MFYLTHIEYLLCSKHYSRCLEGGPEELEATAAGSGGEGRAAGMMRRRSEIRRVCTVMEEE